MKQNRKEFTEQNRKNSQCRGKKKRENAVLNNLTRMFSLKSTKALTKLMENKS